MFFLHSQKARIDFFLLILRTIYITMPIKKCLMVMALLMAVATMEAQNNDTTGVWKEKELQGVTIRSGATTRRVAGAEKRNCREK